MSLTVDQVATAVTQRGNQTSEIFLGKLPDVIWSFSHWSWERIDWQVKQSDWVNDASHAFKALGVRQHAGFIICSGPRRAITKPWNDASAVNVHFSVTKSAACLWPRCLCPPSPPPKKNNFCSEEKCGSVYELQSLWSSYNDAPVVCLCVYSWEPLGIQRP